MDERRLELFHGTSVRDRRIWDVCSTTAKRKKHDFAVMSGNDAKMLCQEGVLEEDFAPELGPLRG